MTSEENSKSVVETGTLLFLSILVLAPVATVLLEGLLPGQGNSLALNLIHIFSPQILETIVNSLWLALWVLALTFLISFPLALLLAKTSIGKNRWLEIVFLIPFMTPPYISSMGWILFMQNRGLLEQLLPVTQGLEKYFFSFPGLVLVMTFNVFPFMVKILTNAFASIHRNLDEAGIICGATPLYRLRRITLPLVLGNIAIGSLLVFVKTLSEYGTPATLGRRIGYEVFTSQIHFNATMAPVDFSRAAALSSILMTICLLFWTAQHTITKNNTYALVGSKGSNAMPAPTSKITLFLGWFYIGLLILVSIGIPWFSIITTSMIKLRGKGLAAGNFTLAHYFSMFTENPKAFRALVTSMNLAILASTLCVFIGTSLALIIHRAKGWLRKVIESCSLLPEMLPNIVMVIGLMLFWNRIWKVIPLYNTNGMLLLSYIVMFLPFTVQYVSSSMNQINEQLIHAGKVFGGSPGYILVRILLPLLIKGITAGWIMTFIISFRELVASSIISPPGVITVSTFIMREFEQGSVPAGMCMAVICVLVTCIVLFIQQAFQKKSRY